MYRSQRFLLRPTVRQARLMAGAAGLSRFAWNWALALCRRHYRWFGSRSGFRRPTAFTIQKLWNRIKKVVFPWASAYHARVNRIAANIDGLLKKVEPQVNKAVEVSGGGSTSAVIQGSRDEANVLAKVRGEAADLQAKQLAAALDNAKAAERNALAAEEANKKLQQLLDRFDDISVT